MFINLSSSKDIAYFNQSNDYPIPDTCPVCHMGIEPLTGFAHVTRDIMLEYDVDMDIMYRCPRSKCGSVFVAHYVYIKQRGETQYFDLECVYPQKPLCPTFVNEIHELSPSFVEIYNEALQAESLRLLHICGMGFRKSLEFLVKDYLINYVQADVETVRKSNLVQCIKKYIDNPKIRDISERAAWLGNDESHYERKWLDRDVGDLKILISMVVHYIEMELLSRRYNEQMPQGKP